MPKPGLAKVAVIGLLLVLLLSPPGVLALTLPSPPDRSAPENNVTGSQQSPGESFDGGIFLVRDGSSYQNVSTNEFIAQFFCVTGSRNLAKQFSSEVGESISGPISKDQASGIVKAMKSVMPPATVNLPITLSGVYGSGMEYFLTGVTYNVTTYSVWVSTQQSPPTDQKLGYIVVSTPTRPQIGRTSQDLAGAFCPSIGYVRFGAGFGPSTWSWLTKPLSSITSPPKEGIPPIISYGVVRILSSSGVAGAAHIRPGENATFVLPPGTYSAETEVTLFGVPFSVGSGTYSSTEGDAVANFAVSSTSATYVWYALEISATIVTIAVILVVARKWRLGALIVRASSAVSRAVRSAWDALSRSSGGAAEAEVSPELNRGARPPDVWGVALCHHGGLSPLDGDDLSAHGQRL